VKYKSHFDWWAYLFNLAVHVVVALPPLIFLNRSLNMPDLYDLPQPITAISIMAWMVGAPLCFGFFANLGFRRTHYTLGENELFVKRGLFHRIKVPYNSIISAQLTNDNWARLRLGFTRNVIHVKYQIKHGRGSVFLSLRESQEFLEQLRAKQTGGVNV